MNQDTCKSLAIEELEQRLEMSAVPALATEDGVENDTRSKCQIEVEL